MRGSDSGGALLERRMSRRFQVYMIGEGVLVGIVGGAIVTLYRYVLSGSESLLRVFVGVAREQPVLIAAWVVCALLLCVLTCKLLVWEPYTQGSGIPQVDAEVMGQLDMPWWRVTLAKFIEGTLCCLGGLSLGREGPSVQLGAMGGKAVSKIIGRGRGEERLLVTCGAAAGMSAAFSAPLTGVLFAIEEIHKEFTAPLIISVMASAVSSDFIASQVLGLQPVLKFPLAQSLPHACYLFVIALGVLSGLLGAAHNRGMFLASERLYARVDRFLPYARLVVPFAASAVLVFFAPQFTCGGEEILKLLESPQALAVAAVAFLLVGKYLATTLAFASGAPGGTLFPLCVMGALCGYLFATVSSHALGLPQEFLPNFVVLGIAGLFASVVRAPVTAVVLAFELTGSLEALLSVSVVSVLSYVTANLTGVDPFYEHLLGNLLGATQNRKEPGSNGSGATPAGEKVLHTITVGAGSKVEGKRLRDIEWPSSTRIVLISRANRDITPTGDTVLESLDECLVLMDGSSEDESYDKVWKMLSSSLTSNWTPKSSRLRVRVRDIFANRNVSANE